MIGAILPERDEEDGEEEEEEEEILAAPRSPRRRSATRPPWPLPASPSKAWTATPSAWAIATMDPIIVEPQRPKKERKRKETGPTTSAAAGVIDTAASDAALAVADLAAEAAEEEGEPVPTKGPRGRAEPVIVEPAFHAAAQQEIRDKEKQIEKDCRDFIPLGDGKYKLPPISLLKYDDTEHQHRQGRDARAGRRASCTTLADLRRQGPGHRHPPRPGRHDVRVRAGAGHEVSKIAGLSDDLAMAPRGPEGAHRRAHPGQGRVGFEVPNKHRETVFFKEIVADDASRRRSPSCRSRSARTSQGSPVAVDLAKMPHLLVAGTTGAGKSVGVNVMLASILFNATPEEVRMIMIDPRWSSSRSTTASRTCSCRSSPT